MTFIPAGPCVGKAWEAACSQCSDETRIAAPLSHGSNPNSNAAGRRREDDENLVAQPLRRNIYNNSDPGMEASMHVQQGASVRRLTPTECERLQALRGPRGRRHELGRGVDREQDHCRQRVESWAFGRLRSSVDGR